MARLRCFHHHSLGRVSTAFVFSLCSMAAANAAVQTHGPVVGGVNDASAKVWVRTDSAADVQITYSRDPGLQGVSRTTRPIATVSDSDFTAITQLRALQSNVRYYYQVLVDGVPQQTAPYPSFTTFPPPGENVDFTFAALADVFTDVTYEAPVYARVNEEQPAFVVQVGDWDHRNPRRLAAMREMHRQVRGPEMASGVDFLTHIGPNLPVFHTWDDHDYGAENGDKTFAFKADAIQAFKEYFPTPPLPNGDNGIWHSFVYGNAEFFMIDVRSNRDPNEDPDGPEKSLLDGDNIVNGQKQWLFNELRNSEARWKFLFSGVCFNAGCKPADAWAAFPDERTELVNFINDNNIQGVIFVTGDMHTAGAIDDGTNSDFPEISVPHTNMPSIGGATGTTGEWSEGLVLGTGLPGYALITVSTNPDQVVLEAKGYDGALRLSYIVTQ